tara:strand:+ start:34 stop:660 length:627 start_codon:yes stop_codon:yes gene_type:complete
MEKALILAPHPDDGEFSSGGTINRFIVEKKYEFWYIAFSPCTASIPDDLDDEVLYEELNNSILHLGINSKNLRTYDIPVRNFPDYRQKILDILIDFKRDVNPDLVLLPSSNDIHQDHQVIHNEGIRAFKNVSILGYEIPWNNFEFSNRLFIKLEKKHLNAKWNAIKQYKSQKFRQYSDRSVFDSLARLRGSQINTRYAESFEIIRWII